jgi:hypothetical protein
MREIKYRGKRIDNGKWHYGPWIYELSDCLFIRELGELQGFQVDPKSVGISIHKYDRDNVEIYENDILDIPEGWSGDYREKRHLAVIEWDEDFAPGFWLDKPDDVSISNCKVIGNKYDNPTMMDYEEAVEELNKEFPTKAIPK